MQKLLFSGLLGSETPEASRSNSKFAKCTCIQINGFFLLGLNFLLLLVGVPSILYKLQACTNGKVPTGFKTRRRSASHNNMYS
jgi:hypothetical protein